jgi:hypothetical protein
MDPSKHGGFKKNPASNNNSHKKSSSSGNVSPQKQSANKDDPASTLALTIAWNFHKMDSGGEWGCDFDSLSPYAERLANYFEDRTPKDIFSSGYGDRHSHSLGVEKICRKAKDRLSLLQIDPEPYIKYR